MTQTARSKHLDKLYANAKATAKDSLGGDRAYAIQAPAIRRMAVAAAILGIVTLQDDSIAAETVRDLANELNDRLVNDGEKDWI